MLSIPIHKHSMHLHLLRSSFPSMMFCSFQCTGVAPLLNLFLIILFFCCYNKWNCFLNFIIEFPSSILYDSFFFNPHQRTCFLFILEREEGGKRKTRMSSHQGLNSQPRLCALTGNRICNLLVYGMMLQPTEQPSQSYMILDFRNFQLY